LPFVWLKVATVAKGFVASIVIDNAAEVVAFPAESVSVTVNDQTPSARVAKVQEPVETSQLMDVLPAFDAVKMAVPVNVPLTLIVGVLTLVTSSVLELPRSDPVVRSGVDGVVIVDLFITIPVSAVEALDVISLKVCVAEIA
jgi:hypothetical protein